MKAIINKNGNFGTLNKMIKPNSEIRTLVNQHLKTGTAKKLIDTEETLMYELVDFKLEEFEYRDNYGYWYPYQIEFLKYFYPKQIRKKIKNG